MNNEERNDLQQGSDQNNEPFESDAAKLANRHMADPNHVITDEDFKNIKVGVTPPPDAPTQEAIKDGEDRIADHKADKEDDIAPGAQKTTPWDVIGP